MSVRENGGRGGPVTGGGAGLASWLPPAAHCWRQSLQSQAEYDAVITLSQLAGGGGGPHHHHHASQT